MNHKPYWVANTARTPISHNHKPIPSQASVVVIGASLAGIFTAYWLHCRGVTDIVILDRGPYIGYDDFGRSLGVSRPPISAGLSDFALKIFARNDELLQKFFVKNEDNLGFYHRQTGALLTSSSHEAARQLQEIRRGLEKANFSHHAIDIDGSRNIIPSDIVYDSIFTPGGVTVDPFSLMNVVVEKLEGASNKTQFITNTHVNAVESVAGGFDVYIDGGDMIHAQYVVHANNHTGDLEYIRGYREQLIATDDLSDGVLETFPSIPIFMDNGNSCFLIHHNRLLYSFLDDQNELTQFGYTSVRGLSEVSLRNSIRTTGLLFPATNISIPQHIWSRMVYMTDDNLPVVGQLDNENEYVISAFGLYDLGLSFITSNLLVKRLIDGTIPVAAKLFDPKRFEK